MNQLARAFGRLASLLVVLATGVGGFLSVLGPATHVKGVWQTNTGNQDRRPLSWRTEIQYLDPERTRFLQVLNRTKTRKTTDPEFKVFEREHPGRWTRINNGAGYASGATSIVVDTGAMFRVDDVVLVPRTGERILVTAVSGNTLTVTRGAQGSTAAAMNDNDWLKLLYSKEEENGLSAEIVTTDVTTVTNFTQIFKRTYGESRTSRQTTRRGPRVLPEERKLAMGLIKEDVEQALLWGRKREETSSGSVVRYTGGIDQFITTNRIDMEGGIGFGDIGYLMNVATRYGGSKKVWLCGRDARQQIDSLGLPYLQIGPKENKLGMAVEGFRTSFGEVMLLTHHGFDNAHADRLLILDPAHVAIAELQSLIHQENLQENDRDGVKHGFLWELGLWIDTEKAHVMVTGLTAKTV